MNVLLVGDLHGEYIAYINKYIQKCDEVGVEIEFVVQVGDFGMYQQVPEWYRLTHNISHLWVPTFMCAGNHEDIREWRKLTSGNLEVSHLSPMQEGDIVTHMGLTMMFCGGATTPLTASQSGVIPFDEKVCDMAIKRHTEAHSPKIDLLVTHEAPNGVGPIGDSLFGNPWTAGSRGIRDLWQTVKPRLMICGHYHKEYDYWEGDLHLRILEEAKNSATILDTETFSLTKIRL